MEETRRSLENEMASPVSLPDGPDRSSVGCVCLVVMDGWGIAPPGPSNAIALARTPVFDELWATYPHAELSASGASVGLPDGQMGNSEVGHLTLGAGAVVPQTLTVINDAVAGGELATNEVVQTALTATDRVHLLGMVSDGGVHSGFEHLRALIALAGSLGVPDLVLHCFTDGRDTPPTAGEGYLSTLSDWCRDAGTGRVASVTGRYYAMDRDRRWERIQAAYDLLVHGRGEHRSSDAPTAAQAAYRRGETDEFIIPTVVGSEGRIRAGDSVLCFNFRPDRMREIVRALAEPGFGEGTRTSRVARARWRVRGATARDHDRVSARMAVPSGVPLSTCGGHTRCGCVSGRRQPAARGRDREVCPRHVLLQRRRGASAAR